MTIRDLARAYVLADASVSALIGSRLYPDMLPQKATYPAGVIQAIDIVRPNTLRNAATLAKARIQIDIYAQPSSGQSSREVADLAGTAIRRRLDGFAGVWTDASASPDVDVHAWVMFDLETEGAEPEIAGGLSRHTADYLVDYETQLGAY